MNKKFENIFPEAMLIPHNQRALKEFKIDTENFIQMQKNILHATNKYSLSNLKDIDTVIEMD